MLKNKKTIKGLLVALFPLALLSCEDNPLSPTTPSTTPTPIPILESVDIPKPDHTVIIVLENHSSSQIIGDSSAPYINELAKSGALFTDSYGLTHPSQPNYLMMFSGSNQGVIDDAQPQNIPFSTPNLASSLLDAKYTFAGYSEDLPAVGFLGATYEQYASKHSPWVYWQGNGTNRLPAEVNQPFNNFPQDFSKLPDVSFVIPNMDNDMHNGLFNPIVKTGDKWVKDHLDSYVQWAKNNNSLLILTFDEDNRLANNKIATVFVGPMVKQGTYNEKINHYNVLRTLEDMFKLPYAGESANFGAITDCWIVKD
jgi:hypothetical protein